MSQLESLTTLPCIKPNQRIVLLHTKGPFAGLHQIMGHSDEFEGRTPDAVTEPFDIMPGARRGMAGLVRSTPRFLLYKEIDKAEGLGTFDARQR